MADTVLETSGADSPTGGGASVATSRRHTAVSHDVLATADASAATEGEGPGEDQGEGHGEGLRS